MTQQNIIFLDVSAGEEQERITFWKIFTLVNKRKEK